VRVSLSDPQDTLAFHLARPLTVQRDMSHVPCKLVGQKVSEFMLSDTHAGTVPEKEALWFYGMNHGLALIAKEKALYEPLGEADAFVDAFYETLGPKAVRAFYYLLLICTRESRHLQNATGPINAQLKSKFGPATAAFSLKVHNKGSDSAAKLFMNEPPDCDIGSYVKSLQHVFYHGSWGGGFGGENWGKVTDCLVRFVTGEFSGVMMLDNVWTLAHNNGPIFNKGMLYGHYSANLLQLLDVQNSGQIPEAVFEGDYASLVEPKLFAWMKWLRARYPEAFGSYLDWYKVEALGAKHPYANHKAKQLAKHGASVWATQQDKAKIALALAAKQKQEEQAKKQAEAQKLFAQTNWQLGPTEWVPKFTPKRKAA
jgi:hypothetical protein